MVYQTYNFSLRSRKDLPSNAPGYRFRRSIQTNSYTKRGIENDQSSVFREKVASLWKREYQSSIKYLNSEHASIATFVRPIKSVAKLPKCSNLKNTTNNNLPSVMDKVFTILNDLKEGQTTTTNTTFSPSKSYNFQNSFRPCEQKQSECNQIFETKHKVDNIPTTNAKKYLKKQLTKHKRRIERDMSLTSGLTKRLKPNIDILEYINNTFDDTNIDNISSDEEPAIEWEKDVTDEFDDGIEDEINMELFKRQNLKYRCDSPGRKYNQDQVQECSTIDKQTEKWNNSNGKNSKQFEPFLKSMTKVNAMYKNEQNVDKSDSKRVMAIIKKNHKLLAKQNKSTFKGGI